MGTFKEHIAQSESNLHFLSNVSKFIDNSWDWQVTVCFYSALHLINAHIAEKVGINYLSHKSVDYIINPYNKLSIARLDENTYMSYSKLCQLARRSRYLISENYNKETFSLGIQKACTTYSKHLSKAVRHLEVIINYIKDNHNQSISNTDIKCIDLKGSKFKNFNII